MQNEKEIIFYRDHISNQDNQLNDINSNNLKFQRYYYCNLNNNSRSLDHYSNKSMLLKKLKHINFLKTQKIPINHINRVIYIKSNSLLYAILNCFNINVINNKELNVVNDIVTKNKYTETSLKCLINLILSQENADSFWESYKHTI